MAKGPTQSQIKAEIAERLGIPKASVNAVLDAQQEVIGRHLSRSGTAYVPGVAKLTVKHKPATRAHKGVNPFTNEPMTFRAKPARDVVKVRPLKSIKDSV